MALINGALLYQTMPDQSSAPALALPPGLQLLADQFAAAPKLQSLRPRLAPRLALNFIPGPRSAPSNMRGPPPSASHVSRRPGRLGSVLHELKGLPPAPLDVTDAWLAAASSNSNGNSSVAHQSDLHVSNAVDASVAKAKHKSDDSEVLKALRAAAATNNGNFAASDSQIKSWLASTANEVSETSSQLEPIEKAPRIETGQKSLEQIDSSVLPLPQHANEGTPLAKNSPEEATDVSDAAVVEHLAAHVSAIKTANPASIDVSVSQPPVASTSPPQIGSQALHVADPTSQELTGLDMLRAMAETQKSENVEEGVVFDTKRAAGGYAMVSMMHRAAENAKANMRSRMAAELLQSESKSADGIVPEEAQTLPPEAGYLYLGRIPKGTSEGLVMAACTKFGSVSSLFYDAKAADIIEGAWALVKFAKQESAMVAVSRMPKRSGLFGSTEPLEVRLATSEDVSRAEKLRESAHMPSEEGIGEGMEMTPQIISGTDASVHPPDPSTQKKGREHERKEETQKKGREHDRKEENSKRKDDRDHKRKKDRRHDRKRKREDRDDRSRKKRRRRSSDSSKSKESKSKGSDSSKSKGSGGKPAPARAAPPMPVVKEERKVRGLGGFGDVPSVDTSKAFNSGPNVPTGLFDEPGGGRQVGIRGSWAEFATPDNRSYYVNIMTGAKQWPKPIGFDNSTRTGAAVSRSGANQASGLPLSNVFVGSLPNGLNELVFRQLFEQFGRIVTLKLVPEQRYGFIKYGQVSDAQKAIDVMNGSVLGGSPLIVKFANMDRQW